MNETTTDVITETTGASPLGADQVPTESPNGGEDRIEVRRRPVVSILLGVVAAVLAAGYLVRALGGGTVGDWLVLMLLVVLAAGNLLAVLDARSPLLVADAQGVRIRLGRTWRGMPWQDLAEIEHLPRRGLLRDGHLALLPRDEPHELGFLGSSGRREASLSARLHGAPFAVPLSLTTRVIGGGDALTDILVRLAGQATTVVEIDPSMPDPPAQAGDEAPSDPSIGSGRTPSSPRSEPTTSPAPDPSRAPVVAVRHEVTRPHPAVSVEGAQDIGATGEAGDPGDAQDTVVWRPDQLSTQQPEPTRRMLVEESFPDPLRPDPVPDPVVGPRLASARGRLGLSVDQLAERTRIRPHVIEAIEVDDFAPCGGDFYARGHLRTLARVLGVDAAPLLAQHEELYAHAPIDARRVFEAELATGGGGAIRGTRAGPNWSVLVAAVMALVLAWSIARLVMDSSANVTPPTPGISLSGGSEGAGNPYAKVAAAVPVVITAPRGGARVVVRDARGDVVSRGDLAFGASETLKASPPLRVISTDGSVTVSIDGVAKGPIGKTGRPGRKTFPVGSN